MTQGAWIEACRVDELAAGDVIRFDHGGRTYAVYRTGDDRFFATDGLCTHEHVHLAGGLVNGCLIECPKHNGQFDFVTGKATRVPARIDLATYPTKVEGGNVYLAIGRDPR